MDSPRNWPHLFTGISSIIAAIVGALISYWLTEQHVSKQNADLKRQIAIAESPSPKQGGTPILDSCENERALLRNQVIQLQADMSTEQRNKQETEQGHRSKVSELRSQVTQLQTEISTEQRTRQEAEQELQKLQAGGGSQRDRINALQSKISELQNSLDSLKARYTAQEGQLKKFSEDSQSRIDRARANYLARRWHNYPAPDGSNRGFSVVYDEHGVDILPPKVKARFDSGQ